MKRKLIAVALCALMVATPINQLRSQEKAVGLVVLGIGLVVGGFIIYHIWRLADRIPAPQRPPVPPPPQTGTTNAPVGQTAKKSALLNVGNASILWDITAYSASDSAFWDRNGKPYDAYIKVETESSANGAAYSKALGFRAWFNAINGVVICSDSKGTDFATNFFALAQGWPIVGAPELAPAGARLFRTVKQQ